MGSALGWSKRGGLNALVLVLILLTLLPLVSASAHPSHGYQRVSKDTSLAFLHAAGWSHLLASWPFPSLSKPL